MPSFHKMCAVYSTQSECKFCGMGKIVIRVCTRMYVYTGCIKMIGAVLKLIIFTSMVNGIINTSRNERVTQQVYDTCLQMFDVTRHTSRR